MTMMSKPVGIIGTGSFLPDNVVTNFDLEKMVDTNDQWIRERTVSKKDALHRKV